MEFREILIALGESSRGSIAHRSEYAVKHIAGDGSLLVGAHGLAVFENLTKLHGHTLQLPVLFPANDA
jgi:hypothetical protein